MGFEKDIGEKDVELGSDHSPVEVQVGDGKLYPLPD